MIKLPGCIANHRDYRGRVAVDLYWNRHPHRAESLAIALARRTGPPKGWRWASMSQDRVDWRDGTMATVGPETFRRSPPLPWHGIISQLGLSGRCLVCGQPIYHWGWHKDLWGKGINKRASWHACCAAANRVWSTCNEAATYLAERQDYVCPISGQSLFGSLKEVDHEVPLYRVWRDHRDEPWPGILKYWGLANLRVVLASAHKTKSAEEARERASHKGGARLL